MQSVVWYCCLRHFRFGKFPDVDPVAFNPVPVRLCVRYLLLDLIIGDYPPFNSINEQQLSRHETAFVSDLIGVEVLYAHLGTHDDHVVPGDYVP